MTGGFLISSPSKGVWEASVVERVARAMTAKDPKLQQELGKVVFLLFSTSFLG